MKYQAAFLALLASASASLNITLCSDRRCKDPPLSTLILDASSGCQTDFAGLAQTVKVTPTDSQKSSAKARLAARFYRSTDCFATCGSNHLIVQLTNGSAITSPGLSVHAPLMQSFEVVELDSEGRYPPHGDCGLRHGDAQFIRGRTWKWQQIGKDARSREPVFKEIPYEEWDDAVHMRLEGSGYSRHGAVDSMRTMKWEQYALGKWGGVPLEMWDEDMNVCNSEPFDMDLLGPGFVEGEIERLQRLRAKRQMKRRE